MENPLWILTDDDTILVNENDSDLWKSEKEED